MTGRARRVALVAWHVFKEGVRDRVLYAIGGVAVLLVLASVVVAEITAGQDVKIVKDFGLAVIEMAVLLMAIVVGVGLVAREIERRSIVSLLSKPLARWELVVGKYGGLLLTVAANLAGMTAVLYLLLGFMATQLTPGVRAALDAPVLDPRLLLVTVMTGAEAALLVAVALFFSTFSSSALLSTALTVGIYVIGLLSADLRSFGDIVDVSPVVARVVQTVGWTMPAFSAFDIKTQIVHGLDLPGGFVATTVLYAVVHIAAILAASIGVFRQREFP